MFSDANGQYKGFDFQTHTVAAGHTHYENIPGWDQYRTLFPLQSILAPDETGDVAQSLVDDAEQGGGGMPRWQQASRNSAGMCRRLAHGHHCRSLCLRRARTSTPPRL